MLTHRVKMNSESESVTRLARVTRTKIKLIPGKQDQDPYEVISIASDCETAERTDDRNTSIDADGMPSTVDQPNLNTLMDVVVGIPMVTTFECSDPALCIFDAKAA